MKIRLNKTAKLSLKLILTGFAFWLIFKKVELSAITDTLLNARPGYLFLALLFFILSKLIAVFRLQVFFQTIQANVSHFYNIRLYLVGMFHNLYLPGGVGGDGYKVYLLNKYTKKPVRDLIGAILFDRINGLVALIILALLLSLLSSIKIVLQDYFWVMLAGLFLIYPLYTLTMKKFFPVLHRRLHLVSLYSLLSQSVQLICTYFILKSLFIDEMIMEYQALFMLASILTLVPVTFGGIGIREMVFVLSYQMLGLAKDTGVSFTLLFFVITALVSLSGAFLKTDVSTEK